MFKKKGLSQAALILIVTAFTALITAGQSGVIFIPSTQTQDKSTFHLSLETYLHLDRYQKGGFQSFGPSLVYGLSKNVEVGINYYTTRDADGYLNHVEPNVKWRAYNNEDTGVSVALGTLAFVPLNRRSTNRSSAQFYANASKKFKSAGNTKLTAGVYTVAAGDEFGTRTGTMIGIEKPVTGKLTALADWTSGNNALGTSNIALSYKTNSSQSLTVAYSFGNTGRGNNFVSVYYGIIF